MVEQARQKWLLSQRPSGWVFQAGIWCSPEGQWRFVVVWWGINAIWGFLSHFVMIWEKSPLNCNSGFEGKKAFLGLISPVLVRFECCFECQNQWGGCLEGSWGARRPGDEFWVGLLPDTKVVRGGWDAS